MQRATLFAFLSVLCASTLLVGPYAAVHTLWNLGEALGKRSQGDRLNTQAAVRQRVAMCESTAALYGTLVGPAPGGAPHTPARRPDSAAPAESTGPDGFTREQYKSAAEEIRSRIGQEEILFGLKFSLIGGIMAVLFALFKKDQRDFFEKLVQKRRAAAFFSAALITGVIVDTRLRFNAKIIESLGNWVWCIERAFTEATAGRMVIPWEGFLHFQLDRGANPLMRYSSHLLTSLLYGVAVYLFIVMPRTVNRSTRAMLTHSGGVFFIILICISLSYDCSYGREWTLLGSMVTVMVGAAGLGFLLEGYRVRFATSNACRLTEPIILELEKRATNGRPSDRERARSLRLAYESAARLLEPVKFTLDMRARKPAEVKAFLRKLEMDKHKWLVAEALGESWNKVHTRAKGLSKLKSSRKLRRRSVLARVRSALRARCIRLTLHERYLGWKIARLLRPANVEAAHAAEEILWELYFKDFAERNALPLQGTRRMRRLKPASRVTAAAPVPEPNGQNGKPQPPA